MANMLPSQKKEVLYDENIHESDNKDLMDTVITIIGVIVGMGLLSCLCCLFIKLSDFRLKRYILELARQRGIKVDPDKLSSNHKESPNASENCTIMIPDVGIVF